MKCIVLTVLLCAVALQAAPHRYGLGSVGAGIGSHIGADIGDAVGTGVGVGVNGARVVGNGLANTLGLALGLGGQASQSEYSNGGQFGNNRVNSGASGVAGQEYHKQGASNFHDRGQHHNKVTSITQSEQSGGHDVGGGQSFDTGAHSGTGFNKYENGQSNYGSQSDQGRQGHVRSFY